MVVTAAEAVAERVRALMIPLIPYTVDPAVLLQEVVAEEGINLVPRPHQVVILLVEVAVQVVVLLMAPLLLVAVISETLVEDQEERGQIVTEQVMVVEVVVGQVVWVELYLWIII